MEKAQAVLEEVMTHAIEAGRRARAQAAKGDVQAEGEAFAYYDVLDVLKEQADLLGIQWADRSLAGFDPDSMLGKE